MSKEEILESHLVNLVSEHKDYDSVDKLKKLPEYEIMLSAMQEYADQEKEKVAVAFAEWKDSNVRFVFHNKIKYNLRNSQNVFDNIPDLYKYFITNVYNK